MLGFDWPKRYDIKDREEKTTYLTRWWLLGNSRSKFALMLHKMHAPDSDACHHDHPWGFITLILKGGYYEEIMTEPGKYFTRWNGPGRLLYRPAVHTHRIDNLPKGTCWTLVLRGPLERRWGFWTKYGWQHNKLFLTFRNGIDWCGGLMQEVKRGSRGDV